MYLRLADEKLIVGQVLVSTAWLAPEPTVVSVVSLMGDAELDRSRALYANAVGPQGEAIDAAIYCRADSAFASSSLADWLPRTWVGLVVKQVLYSTAHVARLCALEDLGLEGVTSAARLSTAMFQRDFWSRWFVRLAADEDRGIRESVQEALTLLWPVARESFDFGLIGSAGSVLNAAGNAWERSIADRCIELGLVLPAGVPGIHDLARVEGTPDALTGRISAGARLRSVLISWIPLSGYLFEFGSPTVADQARVDRSLVLTELRAARR
ncbi:Phenylacetic acid catabolic protein [Nocardioides marmoriginsengisoli]|uniref:Phenylacetic acid catabolic protein n=1 Tax=Nocardioides marmoriginsengisoli TaxID=661483 RepID=UPI00161EE9D3|nr:Phenylacetic acid catabolic protein [Nocardioides marmoriginsengisoli]